MADDIVIHPSPRIVVATLLGILLILALEMAFLYHLGTYYEVSHFTLAIAWKTSVAGCALILLYVFLYQCLTWVSVTNSDVTQVQGVLLRRYSRAEAGKISDYGKRSSLLPSLLGLTNVFVHTPEGYETTEVLLSFVSPADARLLLDRVQLMKERAQSGRNSIKVKPAELGKAVGSN